MTKSLMRDEKREAEHVLEKGFENGYSYEETLPIAKYYRHVYEWKDRKIRTEIVKFIKSNDPFFNEILEADSIDSLVKNSRRFFSEKYKPIHIRKKEIDVIKQIRNFKLQKIAIALLLVAKRDGEKGNVGKTLWSDVKRASTVKPTEAEVFECLRTLYYMGYVKFPRPYRRISSDGYHTLLFVDNESSIEITIDSENKFANAGNVYKDYCGGEIFFCKGCNDEFKKNGKNHNYCGKCSEENKRENRRKRDKKYRESKKRRFLRKLPIGEE